MVHLVVTRGPSVVTHGPSMVTRGHPWSIRGPLVCTFRTDRSRGRGYGGLGDIICGISYIKLLQGDQITSIRCCQSDNAK